jgi:hypothetical protein
MISRHDPQSKYPRPSTAAWGGAPPDIPDPDTPRCPYCGHAALPYDAQLSAMLDLIADATTTLRRLTTLLEDCAL